MHFKHAFSLGEGTKGNNVELQAERSPYMIGGLSLAIKQLDLVLTTLTARKAAAIL